MSVATCGCLQSVPDVAALEAVGEGGFRQSRDVGDEQQVADAGGEGERRGFDAGRWRKMLNGGDGAGSTFFPSCGRENTHKRSSLFPLLDTFVPRVPSKFGRDRKW
jgi:hypothetical protein